MSWYRRLVEAHEYQEMLLESVPDAAVPMKPYESPDFPLLRRFYQQETDSSTGMNVASQFDFHDSVEELQRKGLTPPQGDTSIPPFLWLMNNGQPPKSFRWMWNPETGVMLIDWGAMGAGQAHALMLRNFEHARGSITFDKWLRGYYIPESKTVLMRPYGDQERWEREPETMGRISARVQSQAESIFHSILDRFVGSVNVQHNISNVEVREVGYGR